MKTHSNNIVIIYFHCLERQKILTTSNILKTTKSLRLASQTITGIINMKNKSDKSISSLLIDGQIIASAKEISNYFNNFFTSVAKKINKNIVKLKKKQKQKKRTYPYLGSENNNTIFLSPTLPEDIEDLISSLETTKASGPNSVTTKIFSNFNYPPFTKNVTSLIVITTDLFLI